MLLVLLCATGIALSTTIFAVVKTVLLSPLPYPNAERLITLWGVAESFGIDEYPFSWDNYRDYRDQVEALNELAAWRTVPLTLDGGERPVSVAGVRISPNFLAVLGIEPLIGAGFGSAADGEADSGVAMIAYGLWQRLFAGADDVLGRTIRIDGEPYEIVGVLPRDLRYPTPDSELFIPLRITAPPETERAFHFLRVVGRLRADHTMAQAEAELTAVADQLAEAYPDASGELGVRILSLKEQVVGDTRDSLGALFAAAQLLFLIAWANVAILLLARGMARRGELEVRVALGATRARLARLLLGESVALAAVGCALGLLVGWIAVSALSGLDPALLPRAYELRFEPSLVAWGVGLTLAAAVLFGGLPAWSATRTAAGGPVSSTRTTDRRTARFNARLAAVQVVLTFPLLVVSGMQLRSVLALADVDLGYRVEDLLTASVALPTNQFGVPEQKLYVDRARVELSAIAGVESVGAVSHLPFTSRDASIVTYRPDQQGQSSLPNARYRVVSAGFLTTLGIPLLAGRDFEAADDDFDRSLIVVDEKLAAVLWPDRDPIGEVVRLGNDETHWEVIGVAGAARLARLDEEPGYTIYVSVAGNRFAGALQTPSFFLRSSLPQAALAPTVRAVLQQLDPRQAVLGIRPLAAQTSDWLADRKTLSGLLWVLAGASLVLAAAGMYATLAFSVGTRLREMAIRSALGAEAASLARAVLLDGLKPGVAGVFLGAAISVAGSRLAAANIYGVPAIDTPSLAAAMGLLLLASIVAGWAPARRATRQDPVTLLRDDGH